MEELDDFLPFVNGAPLGEDMQGTFLESWLYPGITQQRELGQSLQGQRYLNRHTMQDKMSDAKKAGINPHVAAAGIAGASSASPSSSSAIPAGSAGVASAVQGLQAATSALDSGVNAYEKLNLIPVEKEKRSAEIVSLLEAAGLSHWEAKAIEVMLPDRQHNLQADTFLKIANYRNTCEEYHNIVLEHDRRKADIDRIQKDAALLEQQGNYVKALELKTQAETDGIVLDNWWRETNKTFWETNGYRADDPMDVALRNAAANGKTDAAEAVGNAIESYSYSERKGFNRAEIEDIYKKEFESAKANADVAALFKEFNVDVDTWSQIMIDAWQAISENPKDIKGAAAKMINALISLLSHFQISANYTGSPNGNRLGNHDKPSQGSKYGK